MELSSLSAFLQAADTGSFVAAGKNLGVTASAVGKSVARLEEHLKVRLFHRDTRNMTLTEEGRIFLARCRRVMEELQAGEAELSSIAADPSGRLRISMPLSFDFLMPLMAEFMDAYPSILLDIDLTDRVVDLIEEGFDLVIRTGTFIDSGLMRRSLWRFGYVLVASPGYLAAHGTPSTPEELARHQCLRQRSRRTGKLYDWDFVDDGLLPTEKAVVSELAPLVQLTLLGKGLAYFPRYAVRRQLQEGTLVAVLEGYVMKTEQMSGLWPTSRQLSPRVRAMVDFLSERLKAFGA
ncbi:LysR family transcriptional regulator [Rhizobium leguminosarum]|uniref:LysR family transcriptional regulator n=1 Tax=Rhizobium leguminosarum TaxID=384 RepID=UPI0024A7C2B5|nr:LysR family transcriptional regulator [Rhizobium leguminosarum]MDI5929775.1 LysR family transcriptional regulator [Rhizobium leguminosarum]